MTPLILAIVAVILLGWIGVRALRGHGQVTPPAAATPADQGSQPSAPAASAAAPSAVAGVSGTVHEEIPEVPAHARQTIRGRIHISIRVIVDSAGNVVGARADQPGPSRYFERLAIDAAKKWTFPPADTPARRLRQIRFEFTREGVKGHAVSLQ